MNLPGGRPTRGALGRGMAAAAWAWVAAARAQIGRSRISFLYFVLVLVVARRGTPPSRRRGSARARRSAPSFAMEAQFG